MSSRYKKVRMILMYDLPMDDEKSVREYTRFRKRLLRQGFYQMQYSIYVKTVQNSKGFDTVVRNIQGMVPKRGNVRIIKVTEKQYEDMIFLQGRQTNHELIVSNNELVVFGGTDEES